MVKHPVVLPFVCLWLLVACGSGNQIHSQKTKAKIAAIGFYNVENLFDIYDDPNTLDEEFTPEGQKKWNADLYKDKLSRLATVLSELGTEYNPHGCAIIGLCEVENRQVLEDLVRHEKIQNRYYKIVHYDSPDNRGVDVALIFQSKYFTLLHSKAHVVPIWDGDSPKKTRDVLLVKGKLGDENLYVLVNHWPSRRGGEVQSEPWRISAALVNKKLCDSIMLADSEALIMVMGDLNDNPNNRSISEVLQARKSKQSLKQGEFFNPFYTNFVNGYGTIAHDDSWSLFDQILLSPNLVKADKNGYRYYKHEIYARAYMIETQGLYRDYPKRSFSGHIYNYGYSDHFPVCVYLVKQM